MKIVLGIVFFFILVIIRAKQTDGKRAPYISIIVISLLLTIFVLVMLFIMPKPLSLL